MQAPNLDRRCDTAIGCTTFGGILGQVREVQCSVRIHRGTAYGRKIRKRLDALVNGFITERHAIEDAGGNSRPRTLKRAETL